MATITAELELTDEVVAAPRPATLSEYLEGLGDVEPSRIMWTPRPGTATEADLLACGLKLVELIDGTLVRKTMGKREGNYGFTLCTLLGIWNRQARAGEFSMSDGMHRLDEGLIRVPDISFTAWKSVPNRTAHIQSVADYSPDLAIEILSESNRAGEMRRKIREYFTSGTKLVWVVSPKASTITVYSDASTSQVLTITDTLDGGRLLVGFSLPLVELFGDENVTPHDEPDA